MISIYRFIFFVYFADFSVVSSLKLYVLKAFWLGFRFDLSIVAYINVPITLLFLICLLFKSYPFFKTIISFIKYYYSIIFSLLFLVIFIDMAFFAYFGCFGQKELKWLYRAFYNACIRVYKERAYAHAKRPTQNPIDNGEITGEKERSNKEEEAKTYEIRMRYG